MLKKALTAGATVILAILASAGVAEAGEAHASQVLPLPPLASPAEPESTTLPDPEEDSESTSDADSTSDPDATTDPESDTTTDPESDITTEPEEETDPVETAPAPTEEAPSAGPFGLIESLVTSVTSLFG